MRIVIFMLAALAAAPAIAQEPGLYDHHTMLKELRSNGIEPTQVAWDEVNPLCVAYMNYKDDPSEYEHCLYDKAVLAVSFATDRETCNIESLAVTPDSLRKNKTVIATYKAGAANDELTTIETPRISRTELRTSRAATYNRCMIDFGWKNPRNWRLGYAQ